MRSEFAVFVAFAVVTAIQLFYYLWFFSRVAFHKPAEKTGSQPHPVSVIICARDESRTWPVTSLAY
jgi:hypothetical protein